MPRHLFDVQQLYDLPTWNQLAKLKFTDFSGDFGMADNEANSTDQVDKLPLDESACEYCGGDGKIDGAICAGCRGSGVKVGPPDEA